MTLAPDDPRHGSTNGYSNLGCRCLACREANRVSHREYMRAHPEQRERQSRRERERKDPTGEKGALRLAASRAAARRRKADRRRKDAYEAALRLILHLHGQGLGARAIADKLNAAGVPTRNGRSWHGGTVHHIIDREIGRTR